GQLMNFNDDQETDVSQVPTKDTAWKDRLKSLWSGNQQVRWASRLAGSLLDLCIAMADPDLEVDLLPPPSEPIQKVPVERSEWSDVDDLDARSAIRLIQEPREDRED